MLQLEEARKKILEKIQPLGSEIIPLSTSFQRVLAEEIMALVDLPPFDNSAMDGYAVQSQDLILARADSPIGLQLIGRIAAGEFISSPLKTGTCVRIFTGSPLPPGADAVVMQEEISLDSAHPEKIFFCENVRPEENIRHRGEDVRKNSILLKVGQRMTAGQITLLAAVGIETVRVRRQPIVGLLATG
ncbi:MAG: molybdopterin molybdotransferase MoeA, partial [Limisphaerales bacterium]